MFGLLPSIGYFSPLSYDPECYQPFQNIVGEEEMLVTSIFSLPAYSPYSGFLPIPIQILKFLCLETPKILGGFWHHLTSGHFSPFSAGYFCIMAEQKIEKKKIAISTFVTIFPWLLMQTLWKLMIHSELFSVKAVFAENLFAKDMI